MKTAVVLESASYAFCWRACIHFQQVQQPGKKNTAVPKPILRRRGAGPDAQTASKMQSTSAPSQQVEIKFDEARVGRMQWLIGVLGKRGRNYSKV